MTQKKVERNVFIHYNVRLQLQNTKKARNQSKQKQYCPINLDSIFAEDDPFLPWLEHREKEKDIANSEKESYLDLVQRTTQTTQEEVIEVQEDSSATQSDLGHDEEEEEDDNDDEDDDDDNSAGGSGGSGGGGIGSISETFMPSTYPYPHCSTSRDRRKSPIIEEEEEEDEGEENEDVPRMNLIERRSPWPSGYPNVYLEAVYSQHPSQPVPPGAGSFSYFFGYPPQYGYGYGQTNYNNNNDDDYNIQEPPKHSF